MEGQVGKSGMFGLQGSKAHNNESVDKVDIELLGQLKIVKFCQFEKLGQNYENLLNIVKFYQIKL